MTRKQMLRVRNVWAAYSARPSASIREICAQTGYTYNMVARHRRILRAWGYLEFDKQAGRATRIIVPLMTMGDGVRWLTKGTGE